MGLTNQLIVLLLLLLCTANVSGITVSFEPRDVMFELDKIGAFKVLLNETVNDDDAVLKFSENADFVVLPPALHLTAFVPISVNSSVVHIVVNVSARSAGKAVLSGNVSIPDADLSQAFVRLTVYNSEVIRVLILVVGWIYFAAWSLSYYPQIISNFERKSVVGFNLDFLALNLVGHMSYLFFNAGLFWSDVVQAQYYAERPHGIIPVQINDVFFSIHAVAALTFQCIQCAIYERGGQVISKTCRLILGGLFLFVVVCLILSLTDVISVLTYLYYYSYIKLGITFIKYCPQLYTNFKRKSTEGWSMGYTFCDFVGGTQSVLQMLLMSYNFDDWGAIPGDPTKLGLGIVSVLFDIAFMIQHFCIYRGNMSSEEKARKKASEAYTNQAFAGVSTYL